MKTKSDRLSGTSDSPPSFILVSSSETIRLPDRRGSERDLTERETSTEEIVDPVAIEPMAGLPVAEVAATEEDIIYSREPEEFDDTEAGDDEDTPVPTTT